jgi:amino acid adenylation domain-containing protein/FkbM family methyltransferase
MYVDKLIFRPNGDEGARSAVISSDGTLSYDDLWDQIYAIQSALELSGVGAGDRVVLYLGRSADYVASLIAIFRLRAVAVPIDPEFPESRIESMLQIVGYRLIVHAGSTTPTLNSQESARCLNISEIPSYGYPLPLRDHSNQMVSGSGEGDASQTPALILFTSGTTGVPKAVVLHHAGVSNRINWGNDQYEIDCTDRVIHKASIAFDAALHEILAPLAVGATLVIAPPGVQYDSLAIIRLIQETSATTVHFIPSVLRYVVDEDEFADCTTIRRIFCGGEALDMALVRQVQRILPCRLYNQYGPTETSISVTFWDCSREYSGTIAPLGNPIRGAECYVLDPNMGLTPAGEAGELWIGGVGVSLGYLNDDCSAQESRFRPDPFVPGKRIYRTGDLVKYSESGNLEFLGRMDEQLKIRGFRIEPADVASSLREHPMVQDVTVVGIKESQGADRLVAYIAAKRRHSPVVDGHQRIELPNSIAVTTPTPDEALFLYKQIFEQGEYARFGFELPPNAVVIDVGANIGLFSLWIQSQSRDCYVVAVEPNPDVLPYLRLNLELNEIDSDICPVAVGEKPGTVDFTSFPQLTYLSGLGDRAGAAAELLDAHFSGFEVVPDGGPSPDGPSPDENRAMLRATQMRLESNRHSVAVSSLSDLVDQKRLSRIDLLKVNTEGSELAVLRSLRSHHWRLVRRVCAEVESQSQTIPVIEALLVSAGFEVQKARDWNLPDTADISYVYAVRPEFKTKSYAVPSQDLKEAPLPALLTTKGLRAHLRGRLPGPMHPDQFVFIEHLPRLPNGKISRQDLPLPVARTAETGPQKSEYIARQGILREIWRRHLTVDAVNDDDNFIALGGHSLTAMRISAAIRKETGIELSPSFCLNAANFEEWLRILESGGATTTFPNVSPETRPR